MNPRIIQFPISLPKIIKKSGKLKTRKKSLKEVSRDKLNVKLCEFLIYLINSAI